MEKDFERWNRRKQLLDRGATPFSVFAGDIWWCSLGVNVGAEMDGKNDDFERPVLVIKHINKDLVLIAPFTSTRANDVSTFKVVIKDSASFIKFGQIRVVSKGRLVYFAHILPRGQFLEIKRLLISYLES